MLSLYLRRGTLATLALSHTALESTPACTAASLTHSAAALAHPAHHWTTRRVGQPSTLVHVQGQAAAAFSTRSKNDTLSAPSAPSSTVAAAAASVPSAVRPPPPLLTYSARDEDLSVPLPSLRYPVVLVHGYLGYASLIRAPWPWSGPLFEYFGGVRTHLGESSQGGITVLTPVNPPAASIAARAKKLRWALGMQSEEEEATAARQGKRVHEKRMEGSSEHTEREVTGDDDSNANANGNGHSNSNVNGNGVSEEERVGAQAGHVEFLNTRGQFDESKHASDSAPLEQHRAEERAQGRLSPPSPHRTVASGPPSSGTSIILGGQKVSLDEYEGKFHLVAHSMGGLDCRYLIAQLESAGIKEGRGPGGASRRIASLTTVGSPHRGSPVADLILDVIDVPLTVASSKEALARAPTFNKISQRLAGWFGVDVTGISNLSTPAMKGFNARVPDAPGVAYQSYGGAREFNRWSVWYLPSKWIDRFAHVHDHRQDGPDGLCPGGPNDGLVSVNSAQWGAYRGTSHLDHLEQIGLGVWNKHIPLYRQMVFRLKEIEEQEKEEDQEQSVHECERQCEEQ